MPDDRSLAVAVLAPTGGDGAIARRMLERQGFETRICSDMSEITRCVGAGVGVLLIAEEALGRAARASITEVIEQQPAWSDLPMVVLLAEGELSEAITAPIAELALKANTTLLERPVRLATLVTTLRSALRARGRQYDVRDSIAERVAAAAILGESEARLRATVLAAPYPLMLHADDGAILQLSRAWSDLSGYSTDELHTIEDWTTRAYGEGSDEAQQIVRDDLERGVATVGMPHALGERQVRTRGGAFLTWDFQSVALGHLPDGRRLRLVTASDVTDFRRLLSSERLARREAEKANLAKMDFLAVMSHELRTPLNAIGGYAQLLELGIHGPLTEAQRGALGRIKRSEEHLLGLINDVLNFAKIEAGRVTFDVVEIRMDDLVAGVEVLLEPQLHEKGIVYEREHVPEVVVRADLEKTRQVLLNLLSNAVKFTPANGRISIGFAAREHEVDVCISDTGIGIPLERQADIFEPFVQVQRGYTSTQGGTGLGLAISRDLARAMGGELSVRSEMDKGSTFTLTLPRATATAATTA